MQWYYKTLDVPRGILCDLFVKYAQNTVVDLGVSDRLKRENVYVTTWNALVNSVPFIQRKPCAEAGCVQELVPVFFP